jgi:hypothetical protein
MPDDDVTGPDSGAVSIAARPSSTGKRRYELPKRWATEIAALAGFRGCE